jgi:hypothetical protein
MLPEPAVALLNRTSRAEHAPEALKQMDCGSTNRQAHSEPPITTEQTDYLRNVVCCQQVEQIGGLPVSSQRMLLQLNASPTTPLALPAFRARGPMRKTAAAWVLMKVWYCRCSQEQTGRVQCLYTFKQHE